MTDHDEQSTPGPIPAMIQEFMSQFRSAAETAGAAYLPRQAAPGTPALPGALSAAQLAAITDGIADQRRSIAALKTQLSAFDEQLAMLEDMLGPLAQWSKTWADLEQRFLHLGGGPQTDGLAGRGTHGPGRSRAAASAQGRSRPRHGSSGLTCAQDIPV